MNLKRTLLVTVLATSAALTGCVEGGIRHGFIMRGQVLDVENGVATVCIGTKDGAKVGQVLEVERVTRVYGSPKSGASTYSRSEVGQVKISELFDEHYARAKILSGSPSVNDVVELTSR